MTSAAKARASPKAREQRRAQAKRYLARRVAKAHKVYADLIAALGGQCEICEEDGKTAPLSVDHKNGHGWDKPQREVRFDVRVFRYWDEYVRGVPLRCLCVPCNSGNRPKRGADYDEPAPF